MNRRKRTLGTVIEGCMIMVVGILMFVMPWAAWSKSIFLALLFSPGLLMGPLFVWMGVSGVRDGFSDEGGRKLTHLGERNGPISR